MFPTTAKRVGQKEGTGTGVKRTLNKGKGGVGTSFAVHGKKGQGGEKG